MVASLGSSPPIITGSNVTENFSQGFAIVDPGPPAKKEPNPAIFALLASVLGLSMSEPLMQRARRTRIRRQPKHYPSVYDGLDPKQFDQRKPAAAPTPPVDMTAAQLAAFNSIKRKDSNRLGTRRRRALAMALHDIPSPLVVGD